MWGCVGQGGARSLWNKLDETRYEQGYEKDVRPDDRLACTVMFYIIVFFKARIAIHKTGLFRVFTFQHRCHVALFNTDMHNRMQMSCVGTQAVI